MIFYGLTMAGAIVEETVAALTGLKAQPVVALTIQLLIAWPLTLWISTRLTNRPWNAFYSFDAFPRAFCVPIILSGIGLCIVLSEAAALIPMPAFVQEFFLDMMSGNRFFAFLGICLVAPVMEELFFRGLVFKSFLERYSVRKAVVASSLLFALFHLNPWQAIVAFPIGVLNAWLVLRTGSLVPGMLAHFATNTTSTFLIFPLGALFGYDYDEMTQRTHFPWQLLAVALAASASGILWLFRLPQRPQNWNS